MLQIIAYALLLFFTLIGVRESLLSLARFIFIGRQAKRSTTVELRGHMEDVEYVLRSALLLSDGAVEVVDMGADEQTLEIAGRMALDHRRIHLVTENEK